MDILMQQTEDWIYNQAGAIPYKFDKGILKILLITTLRRKRWIIPKGIIELDFSAHESALQEAFEEAGVKGDIQVTPVGEYQYKKWEGTCTVKVFPLKVEDELQEWPESKQRTRRWVSVEEAVELVVEKQLKGIIRKLPQLVAAKTVTKETMGVEKDNGKG